MLSNIKTYFKWLWLYFLLWKHFRRYNLFSIKFRIENCTANFTFRFDLKDSPILSFWIPKEEDIVIFFHIAAILKYSNKGYYSEVYTFDDNFTSHEALKHLDRFIPLFIENYNSIHSDDRDMMENNIVNLVKSMNRKNIIDSIID